MAAVAAYAGTAAFELVWDDHLILEYVRSLVAAGGLPRLLGAEFLLGSGSESLGYYRPIVLLSFRVDDLLSGGGFATFHLTNIALHAFNSVMALLALRGFLRSLPPQPGGPEEGGVPAGARADRAALLGALLFAVHPVHTESVSFVAGRTDLLAAGFSFLHVISWMRVRSGSSSRPRAERGWCLLTLAGAGLSKELALLLPATLLVWDAAEPAEGEARGWWRRNGSWLLLWCGSIALVLLPRVLVAGIGVGAKVAGGLSAHALPLLGHPSLVLRVFLKYLRLLVLPVPSRAYYTIEDLSWSWLDGAGALAFGAVCLAAAGRSRGRAGLIALAWVAVFLAPVAGVFPFQGAPAERYLYLPSFGLVLALSSGLFRSRWVSAGTATAWGPVAALVVLCLATTVRQSLLWKDGVTLFSDLARKAPSAPKVWLNLGMAQERRGMAAESAAAFSRAVELDPASAIAHLQLGRALMRLNRFEEAARSFREAGALDPGDFRAASNLGEACFSLGRYEDAVAAYERAVLLQPGSEEHHNNLGTALGAAGRWRDAVPHYEKAIAIRPGFGKARYNLAVVWLRLGDRAAARAEYERLRSVDADLASRLRQAFPGGM